MKIHSLVQRVSLQKSAVMGLCLMLSLSIGACTQEGTSTIFGKKDDAEPTSEGESKEAPLFAELKIVEDRTGRGVPFSTPEPLNIHINDRFEVMVRDVPEQSVTLLAQGVCGEGSQTLAVERKGVKLLVLDLIHPQVLREMLIAGTDHLKCTLTVRVVDPSKKSRRFELSDQLITSRFENDFGVTGGPAMPSTETVISVSGVRARPFVIPAETPNSEQVGKAFVLCQFYESVTDTTTLNNFNFADLLEKGLLSGQEASSRRGETQDSRRVHRIQKCLLLKRNSQGVSYISRRMNVLFEDPQPLQVTVQWFPQPISNPFQMTVVLAQLVVRNPNGYPISLGWNSNPSVLLLMPILGNQMTGRLEVNAGMPVRRRVRWITQGREIDHDGWSVIQLGASESQRIELVLENHSDCASNLGSPVAISQYLGFDFQFGRGLPPPLFRGYSNAVQLDQLPFSPNEEISYGFAFKQNLGDRNRLNYFYNALPTQVTDDRLREMNNFAGLGYWGSTQCPNEI